MTRDPRYDILFEPVRIGPRRGAQPLLPGAALQRHGLPRCLGPGRHARHEGGRRLGRGLHRDGGDPPHGGCRALSSSSACGATMTFPMLARIAEKVHDHGSLAGIELCHSGYTANNLWTREVPIAASPMPTSSYFMIRCRRAAWTRRTSATSAAPTARPRCASKRGGLRPRLCLCRARARHLPALPVARHQLPHRRIWRLARKPRPAAARGDRGHQGRRGRHLRGAGAHRHARVPAAPPASNPPRSRMPSP